MHSCFGAWDRATSARCDASSARSAPRVLACAASETACVRAANTARPDWRRRRGVSASACVYNTARCRKGWEIVNTNRVHVLRISRRTLPCPNDASTGTRSPDTSVFIFIQEICYRTQPACAPTFYVNYALKCNVRQSRTHIHTTIAKAHAKHAIVQLTCNACAAWHLSTAARLRITNVLCGSDRKMGSSSVPVSPSPGNWAPKLSSVWPRSLSSA